MSNTQKNHLEVKAFARLQKQDAMSHTPRDLVERRLKNLQNLLEASNFDHIVTAEFNKYQKEGKIDVDGVKGIMEKTFRELDHPIEVSASQSQGIVERYGSRNSGTSINKSEFSSFYLDFIMYIQMMTETILSLKTLLDSLPDTLHSSSSSLSSLHQKLSLASSNSSGSISPSSDEPVSPQLSIQHVDRQILKNEIEELLMNLGSLVSIKESDLDHCLKKFEKKGGVKQEDLQLLIQEVVFRQIETTRESLYNVEL